MFIKEFAMLFADASSNESWYFKLLSFAGGIVATFVGFLLNQRYQNEKEKIKETKEYISSLQSAANELEFYGAKLTQLSGELEALANTLKRGETKWIIPTYSIYPDFLEKCKIAMNAFYKNAHLVKEVSHCHFELCHILERLDLLKEQMNAPIPAGIMLNAQIAVHFTNLKGFKSLIDSNILVFKATSDSIHSEKSKMESRLRLQLERGILANEDEQ